MVIETDPKKMAKMRQSWTWYLISGFIRLIILIGIYVWLDLLYLGLFALLVVVPAVIYVTWRAISRILRYRRTNHHLFLDGTGIAFIVGHARVDIPWGDVDEIVFKPVDRPWLNTIPGFKTTRNAQIQLKLRKETPYNKRVYRVFDDYELPLYDIYAEIKTLWEQGKGKLVSS